MEGFILIAHVQSTVLSTVYSGPPWTLIAVSSPVMAAVRLSKSGWFLINWSYLLKSRSLLVTAHSRLWGMGLKISSCPCDEVVMMRAYLKPYRSRRENNLSKLTLQLKWAMTDKVPGSAVPGNCSLGVAGSPLPRLALSLHSPRLLTAAMSM